MYEKFCSYLKLFLKTLKVLIINKTLIIYHNNEQTNLLKF